MKNKVYILLIMMLSFIFIGQLAAQQTDPLDDEDLFEMSLEELMEIEVTSVSRREDNLFNTAAAITVITQEDIRRSGHQSVPELLRMVPGIEVARINGNTWAITARGFNGEFSEKLLMMIDGRSVYTPLYSGVYWDVQDVMLEDVERIEVIKGPGGTLWGANAVNGIINIITKNAKDTQGGIITGGGGTEDKTFSSFRYGGKLRDNGYYRFYTKYYNRDGGVHASPFQPGTDDTEQFRTGFRIDLDQTEQDHITIQGDVYNGQSARKTTMVLATSSSVKEDNTDVRGTNILTRWTRKLSETSSMALQFYYDRTERDSIALGETRDTFDLDFQHNFLLNDSHNMIWGLGYRHTGDNIDNSYGVSFGHTSRNDEILSTFVQDEITLAKDVLKLIIGSKFERNNYTGFEYQPSARLLWTPDEKNTVWASFTRAVQTPGRVRSDMTNIYAPFNAASGTGSESLVSQVLKSYEIGYRTKVSDKLILDATGFYNEYDDLYSAENPPNTTYANKLYGESYGAELSARYYARKNWQLIAGYTYLQIQAHQKDSSTDTSKQNIYENCSPHNMFNLRSYLELPNNMEFDTMVYYVDNLPYHNIRNYIRLDLRLGWNITEDMELSIVGQNLLDSRHPEFSGVDTIADTETQRAVYAKLTYRF